MPGLTAYDLTRMRNTQADLMTDTCTVRRLTFAADSADGAGGQTETATDTTSVACRLQPLGNIRDRAVLYERYGTDKVWQLTVHHDTDLIPGDRVIVDSNTYEVKDVDAAHTWLTARRARVTRVL